MTHRLSQFFKYDHLPKHLQQISKPFSILAEFIDCNLPNNHQKDEAFQKLLEAKDCAVRAVLYEEPNFIPD